MFQMMKNFWRNQELSELKINLQSTQWIRQIEFTIIYNIFCNVHVFMVSLGTVVKINQNEKRR